MDLGEIREIMSDKGVEVWSIIDKAIQVASIDFSNNEITIRRDSIVAKLYHNPCSFVYHVNDNKADHSPYTPICVNNGDVNNHDVVNDEQRRILCIKDQIEDPNQNDDALVDLLQTLDDMDITIKALKETDIGRHVNRLRKHPSADVKPLVKQLVRFIPLLRTLCHTMLIIGISRWRLASAKCASLILHILQIDSMVVLVIIQSRILGLKLLAVVAPTPRRNARVKSTQSPASAPLPNRQNEVAIDPDGLASARRLLQGELPRSSKCQKAKNNPSDGHPPDTKTEECFLRKEQK